MALVPLLIALFLLAAAGTVTAVAKAADPGLATGRRVELSILAGLLALVTLSLALVGYWIWGFAF